MTCACHQPDTDRPQTCREHRLWWAPGEHGKAIVFDSGHVLTWPEGEGDHSQHAALRAQQTGERPVAFLHIRVDGTVRIPRRHAHRADELAARLTGADRRLRPAIASEVEGAVRQFRPRGARECARACATRAIAAPRASRTGALGSS